MKIAIGCDHGGYLLKQDILIWLEEHDIDFEDVGCFSTESVDYPIYGEKVARLVASGACEKGIVICTTGIGISIAANKVKGIRCAHCTDSLSAEMTRRHNDANVLALGAGITGPNLAKRIVEVFLNTEFEGGRHARRVGQLDSIQPCSICMNGGARHDHKGISSLPGAEYPGQGGAGRCAGADPAGGGGLSADPGVCGV